MRNAEYINTPRVTVGRLPGRRENARIKGAQPWTLAMAFWLQRDWSASESTPFVAQALDAE
jgi:hypothetical protein